MKKNKNITLSIRTLYRIKTQLIYFEHIIRSSNLRDLSVDHCMLLFSPRHCPKENLAREMKFGALEREIVLGTNEMRVISKENVFFGSIMCNAC